MNNIHDLVIDLRQKLGILYNISLQDIDLIEINTPIVNEIGDNYRLFIKKIGEDMYQIDDDADALGEFGMYILPTKNAYQFLAKNKINTDRETIIINSNQNGLINNIFKMLRIQTGLTAIQQCEEINRKDD